MSEPEIALVFTPEPWVEELHRHLTDHGGARVRQVLLDPDLALEEHYDALVVSPRWPALTRGFVDDVHARRRRVLGVYDREDHASRQLLSAVGVDATIESDASPRAFIEVLERLQHGREVEVPAAVTIATQAEARAQLVVMGGQAGAGRTEVALHVGHRLAAQGRCVVVDADEVAPSVAPRLGLPIEPNLRSAVDAVEHTHGALGDITQTISRGFDVVAGLPNVAGWAQLRPSEVLRVLRNLATGYEYVVVDAAVGLEESGTAARGRYALTRALVGVADVILVVCHANPVGVTRLLTWVADVRLVAPDAALVAVVNRAPRDRFRRAELFAEVRRTAPGMEVAFLRDEARLVDCAWDSDLLSSRGHWTRGIAAVTETIVRNGGRKR